MVQAVNVQPSTVEPAFTFQPATEADFPALVSLRILAMRESLERIGRFDPERAAQRFRSTFRPDDTRLIRVGNAMAGCVAWWLAPAPSTCAHRRRQPVRSRPHHLLHLRHT